ncbi:MAG: class I SAM-dependent rRNA methyltransferase [Planctomycetota bacterium]
MTVPSSRPLPRVVLSVRRRSRHPWIYRKMCRPANLAPGTLVEVVDRDGAFVGRGIYNRKSEIAIRLLTEDPSRLLDRSFFDEALDRAVRFRREVLALDRITDAYRVVNSEGDGLSGLVVDRLGEFAVVELFSAGWFRLLGWLLEAVSRRLDGATVLVRAGEAAERREGFRVRDFAAAKLGKERLGTIIQEGGIRFRVDLESGQKTGFFCDQRENRLAVRELARGKRVLDGFSYTGGFALNASLGGAQSVTGVDLDEKAVALAKENAALNGLAAEFIHSDVFDFLRSRASAGTRYDLVILDPPKFASGRAELERALRRYCDLNALACHVLEPRGLLVTSSCSGAVSEARFRQAVYAGARRAGVRLELLSSRGAAADHPLRPEFPEGRYLKVLTLRAEPGRARGITRPSALPPAPPSPPPSPYSPPVPPSGRRASPLSGAPSSASGTSSDAASSSCR